MKTFAFFIIIYILIINSLYSQKLKTPIDYRFRNGEAGYTAFFSKNIKFPKPTIENGTIGNSITRISINPKGAIDSINIINPIDSLVDNEVIRVINLSRDFWKKCDSIKQDHVFYIQIAFSFKGFKPNLFIPKSKELMKLFPEPVVITPPESLIEMTWKEQDRKFTFTTNEELSQKLNSNLEAGDFEKALPTLNELIERDPFNRDLYKVRIMINIRLGRQELAVADDNKLFDFADGFSLDDLNKDQN